jgi:hypothetical protein
VIVAKFGDVFTTTLKVLASLFIISLVLSIVYALIYGIGSSVGTGGSRKPPDYKDQYVNSRTYYDSKADDAPSKMPLSQWRRVIAEDVKGHCIREGMSTAEVELAVGKPTKARTVTYAGGGSGDVWEYAAQEVVTKRCSKYEGDKCIDPIQYKDNTATLYFSPKGHLTYPYIFGPLSPDLGDNNSLCYGGHYTTTKAATNTGATRATVKKRDQQREDKGSQWTEKQGAETVENVNEKEIEHNCTALLPTWKKTDVIPPDCVNFYKTHNMFVDFENLPLARNSADEERMKLCAENFFRNDKSFCDDLKRRVCGEHYPYLLTDDEKKYCPQKN